MYGSLDALFAQVFDLINHYIVPLIFAVAFIVFLWGIFQYFIAGATSEEKRSQGQQLVIWGIVGFFIMLSLWGIVHVLVGTFGLDRAVTPDLPTFQSSNYP